MSKERTTDESRCLNEIMSPLHEIQLDKASRRRLSAPTAVLRPSQALGPSNQLKTPGRQRPTSPGDPCRVGRGGVAGGSAEWIRLKLRKSFIFLRGSRRYRPSRGRRLSGVSRPLWSHTTSASPRRVVVYGREATNNSMTPITRCHSCSEIDEIAAQH